MVHEDIVLEREGGKSRTMPNRRKASRKKRLFRLPAQAFQAASVRADQEGGFALVLVESTPGKTSVGFRQDEETVLLFAEELEPQEAAQLAANIVRGQVSLEELSTRRWREIPSPAVQKQAAPGQPQYTYTLPEDDQEVIVSGAAMALLDRIKLPPLEDHQEVEARALYNADMAHQHSREPLTNDYAGWKELFIPTYVSVYLRTASMDLDMMREIASRYDILTVLAELRNIVKMLFFPDLADLSRLSMEYQEILLTPHRTVEGYVVSFLYQQTIQRTLAKETLTDAFEAAKQLIAHLKEV
jgi:hypothetical protein